MASAARAYSSTEQYRRYDAYEQPYRSRPNIEVRPGRRKESQAAAQRAISVFKIVLVGIAALAVMCIARIWLINASMDTLAQTSVINESIDDARTLGTQLEVQYYAAANPNKVKSYASENLGMSAASVSGTTIDLTPNVIKEAVPSTVTGGIAVCESVIAEREAQAQAETQAQAQAGAEAQVQPEANGGDVVQAEDTPSTSDLGNAEN